MRKIVVRVNNKAADVFTFYPKITVGQEVRPRLEFLSNFVKVVDSDGYFYIWPNSEILSISGQE